MFPYVLPMQQFNLWPSVVQLTGRDGNEMSLYFPSYRAAQDWVLMLPQAAVYGDAGAEWVASALIVPLPIGVN